MSIVWAMFLASLLLIDPLGGRAFAQHDAAEPNVPAATTEQLPSTDSAAASAASDAPATTSNNDEPSAQTPPPEARPATSPPDAIPGLQLATPANPDGITIGSIDERTGHRLEVNLTSWGAAVNEVTLTEYYTDTSRSEHYQLIRRLEAGQQAMYTFAARAVTVNRRRIDLQTVRWDLVPNQPADTALYRAVILGPDGGRILQIDRRYRLSASDFSLHCEQRLTNLAQGRIEVVWEQNAHGDVTTDEGYLGDRRELVGGYFDVDYDPNRRHIYTRNTFVMRSSFLGDIRPDQNYWPHPSLSPRTELVWLASVNRYFTATLYRPVDMSGATPRPQPLSDAFPIIGTQRLGLGNTPENQAMVFTLTSQAVQLAPGEHTGSTFDLSVYMGPRKRDVFAQQPYTSLHLRELVVYQLGCTWCTFQFLARFLLWFLRLIEGDILAIGGVGLGLQDWGLSIIVLVLIVRLLLHPITKSSQIRMAKMSKAMKAMQPELERLKKKYKNDTQTFNQEMMRLYRERGVSPFNMLGCLPMLLQMPIWVALYAMLYYAIELRQQHAFYGLFQWAGSLFGREWLFLADLSEPDRFIRLFNSPMPVNLFIITLDFQSINILPILMGITFFLQQKLMMPPISADDGTKTEQQIQQEQIQKTMMWMIPIMFPFFMYSVPSGLTLYIMASTLAGIIDGYIVRQHIKREEEAGTLFQKKEPKPGSISHRFQQWMQARVAAAQALQEQAKQAQQQRGGGDTSKDRRGRRRDR